MASSQALTTSLNLECKSTAPALKHQLKDDRLTPLSTPLMPLCKLAEAAYTAGTASASQAQRERALRDLLLFSLVGLAGMTIASGGLGWFMSGRVLRPVRVITETARRASEQHLGERLAPTGARDDTVLDPAETTGDPQLLERMIWNLVDNAVRHNEPGGWIRLRTGSTDAAVYIEIANSGPCIPDDAVPSLFEPFRRMAARTGVRDGAGLGLSITRSVATAHRATVTARGQPGGGLAISVQIPRRLVVEPDRRADVR